MKKGKRHTPAAAARERRYRERQRQKNPAAYLDKQARLSRESYHRNRHAINERRREKSFRLGHRHSTVAREDGLQRVVLALPRFQTLNSNGTYTKEDFESPEEMETRLRKAGILPQGQPHGKT